MCEMQLVVDLLVSRKRQCNQTEAKRKKQGG